MTISTNNTVETTLTGLVAGHAYTILSVHEIISKGKPIKLVKLRNPWGDKEWKGTWSNSSELWTQDLK